MRTLSVKALKDMGACDLEGRWVDIERHLGRKIDDSEEIAVEAWAEATGSVERMCWFLARVDRHGLVRFARWCSDRTASAEAAAGAAHRKAFCGYNAFDFSAERAAKAAVHGASDAAFHAKYAYEFAACERSIADAARYASRAAAYAASARGYAAAAAERTLPKAAAASEAATALERAEQVTELVYLIRAA